MKNLKIFPCIHVTFNHYKVWNGKALPSFTAESLTTNFNLLTADLLLLTGAHLICWKFEIFADCWLHLLTTDFKSLTANFKLLTSSNLCCNRKRPTTGTGVRINRVYFSYLNNYGNASFHCWDTKSESSNKSPSILPTSSVWLLEAAHCCCACTMSPLFSVLLASYIVASSFLFSLSDGMW
jgi:hypothetical protein